jgi:uncharacterized membrane protein (UPF0136 family)
MDAISYGFALIVLSGGVMGYLKAGKYSLVLLVSIIWNVRPCI